MGQNKCPELSDLGFALARRSGEHELQSIARRNIEPRKWRSERSHADSKPGEAQPPQCLLTSSASCKFTARGPFAKNTSDAT